LAVFQFMPTDLPGARDLVPTEVTSDRFRVPLSNRIFIGGEGRGLLKTLAREVQDGSYFLWRDVEHFGDLGGDMPASRFSNTV
jgi:hypothetical protein